MDFVEEANGNNEGECLWESKYCGESFVKSREKIDGHTFKRNPFRPQYQHVFIERTRQRADKMGEYEKLQEVAVTDIDSYFDYGFWKVSNGYRYGGNQASLRPLNSPDKWEDVESFLENNAVKRTKTYSRNENQTTISYEIPVTGHVLCANVNVFRNRKTKMDSWLHWNGKFYDPSFVYFKVMNGYKETFTKLCPRIEGRDDPLMTLGYVNDHCKMNRIGRGVLTSSRRKERPHLEIDLGRVCILDHIGTLGAYPKSIDSFPPYESKKNRWNWIYVLKSEYDLAWVTKYIIHYLDIVTGKWIVYEHPLDGNADVTTEVIHKISIMARNVRIVPLDFHHQKEMRVLLYGEPFSVSQKSVDGTVPVNTMKVQQSIQKTERKGKRRVTGVVGGGGREAEEIQTICYEVHKASPSHVLDGIWRGCSRDCPVCYSVNFENRRRNFRRLVQDEIDFVYDNEEFRNVKILF